MLFLTLNLFSQSVLDPGRGQFFEQGYSIHENGLGNEIAIDLAADTDPLNPAGLVFIGWHENESPTGKDFAFYKTSVFGKLIQSNLQMEKLDDIPTGIVADPLNKRYLVCVRKTNQYIEGSYEAQGDSLLVYSISYGGQISLLYKQGFEEAGLAPIDIALGPQNTFYVLANKKNTNASVTPVLTKFNYNGSVAWQRTYDNEENSIRAHELLIEPTTEGQAIRFSANNITDVPFPMFIGYSDMGTLLHATSYSTQLNMYVDGVAKQSTDYLFAATQTAGLDKQAAVFKINSSLAHQTTYTFGKAEGDEGYSDIIVYPTGFSCTGLIDTASSLTDNEGGKDILISQFTPSGEVILHETVGSQEDEQVGRCIQHPLKPALILAGYHKGYGIHESGNAYIAASLYEDARNLMTGSCEVPRVMMVDTFVKVDNQGVIELNRGILGNPSKENQLIDFAKDNEITLLVLFSIDQLFRVQNQTTTGQQYRAHLNSFIADKCFPNGIQVSMVSGYGEQEYDEAAQFNKHAQTNAFNYKSAGKIHYLMPEHEFWNSFATTSSVNPLYPSDTNLIPTNRNQHYLNCYKDHKSILTHLKNDNDITDANILGIHDYIFYYFNFTWDNPSNIYNEQNTTWRNSIADTLEELSDAIFLGHYLKFQFDSGIAFLGRNNQNGFVQLWQDRLSFLGTKQIGKTRIFPLFSSEYYVNSGTFCGDNSETDFLGKYLGGPPDFLGDPDNSFNKVESIYMHQHDSLYQHTTAYPNIQNVEVSALAWWRYTCMKEKDYTIKDRVNCEAFTGNLLNINKDRFDSNEVTIYPNPSNGFIDIISNKPIESFELYNGVGQLIKSGKFDNSSTSLILNELCSGMYLIKLNYQGNSSTHKVIVR